ncbi:hypothetical protein SEMRO_3729_G350680.1 [Seminavis robusta]|uniref:Uncharacterized protein n=1 Tax=Seminavis robusta TaxID=568900 RepID=A0A9N8HY80_9STRA|nr:hypothetical protein SEMRO_3729_G350680.1 [Seminavis robusta]|eukprot:Sro3729_g350680.1 n/a (167) ;mRNA; f:3260-3851
MSLSREAGCITHVEGNRHLRVMIILVPKTLTLLIPDKDLHQNIERYIRLIHPHDYTKLQEKEEGADDEEEKDNEDKVEEEGKKESEDSNFDDTDGSHDGLDDKKKPPKKRVDAEETDASKNGVGDEKEPTEKKFEANTVELCTITMEMPLRQFYTPDFQNICKCLP